MRLNEIGTELYKVREYANERIIDDLQSQTIIALTSSAYFSGCVPMIRIEQSLLLSNEFRNEYAFALAFRAYLEVAGRLHKGLRLWRQYASEKCSLIEFNKGVSRLLAQFQPKDDSPPGIFPGKGFNVLTLVESLADQLPSVMDIYNDVSHYVHGDFSAQQFARKQSWVSDQRREPNHLIESWDAVIKKLQRISLEDFEELLQITELLRKRHDAGLGIE